MIETLKILMLEDCLEDAELVHRLLKKENFNFNFRLALNKATFQKELEHFRPDVILADNSLPGFDALEALDIVRLSFTHIAFIMVTGSVSEEFAANIIKMGADDYILKDRLVRLPSAIEAAIKKQKEKKEKEENLEVIRKSNERFLALSKATKDAVWYWDLLTDEVWWNEGFFSLLGYDQKMVSPDIDSWTERIHPADRNEVMARLKKIRSSRVDSWENEFRFLMTNGDYGTVLNRSFVIRNESGKPVRLISALMDITGQKKLTKEIEVLSLIAKETNNGVMIFDKVTGLALWVNEGFTRLTGYTQDDIFEKAPSVILQWRDTDQIILETIGKAIQQDLPYSGDILIYTKNGQKRWQYINGQPLREDNGLVTKYFVIATDITERRKTEEEKLSAKIEQQKEITRTILRTQEMERNDLGRELHDNINQILASVNLKLGYYLEEPENNMDIINDCRQNLVKAIRETRNLSHHMVMPRFSEGSVKEEFELLIENYKYKNMVHLDLTGLNEQEIPSMIKETFFRIAQVQLTNVDKHARASKVVIELANDVKQVDMIIQDNGIGFDINQKRKGIGITNIFNRAESYNGTAHIISTPGKGCRLSVTIPLPGKIGHV
ncbi:MAG TPA: PAS domain-containing protein [Puia sp.]|jgi:PAS domain S-box-containing protein|nr:PAS domain-containing protein [Puia sp.]